MKIYVNGAHRRMDAYKNGQLERMTVSEPSEGVIRTYRMQNRECLITPAPKEALEAHSAIVDADAVVTRDECESLGESLCTRFRVMRNGHLSELRWYEDRSGLCIQTQTFDRFGNAALKITWTDVSLDAPPESVFERLRGFREVRVQI